MKSSVLKERFFPGIAAAAITAALLVPVQSVIKPPMLLAQRFLPGAGWAEIALLSAWAFFASTMMLDPARSAEWRLRIWMLFSVRASESDLPAAMYGIERGAGRSDSHDLVADHPLKQALSPRWGIQAEQDRSQQKDFINGPLGGPGVPRRETTEEPNGRFEDQGPVEQTPASGRLPVTRGTGAVST